MKPLTIEGNLSYVCNSSGDVFDIKIGDAFFDAWIDDTLEPHNIEMGQYQNKINFGPVRLSIERLQQND